MADLVFVALVLAFFAVALLLVRSCDRIIGPDELNETASPSTSAPAERRAAWGPSCRRRRMIAVGLADHLGQVLASEEASG